MKLDQKQPSNKGEFFAISVKTVEEIINADAGVEELIPDFPLEFFKARK